MNKITLLFITLFFYTPSQAHHAKTETHTGQDPIETPTVSLLLLRGGMNIMTMVGNDAGLLGPRMGYNITGAFQDPIGTKGVYWGMEAGLGSRGIQNLLKLWGYEEKLIAHNIQWSPVTFGYKTTPVGRVRFDAHAGFYVSYDYAGCLTLKTKDHTLSVGIGEWDRWNRFDCGMNVGLGMWVARFNLDFTYQYGFIDASKVAEMRTSNYMIRLGVWI